MGDSDLKKWINMGDRGLQSTPTQTPSHGYYFLLHQVRSMKSYEIRILATFPVEPTESPAPKMDICDPNGALDFDHNVK